jgi:hypothetical protein
MGYPTRSLANKVPIKGKVFMNKPGTIDPVQEAVVSGHCMVASFSTLSVVPQDETCTYSTWSPSQNKYWLYCWKFGSSSKRIIL